MESPVDWEYELSKSPPKEDEPLFDELYLCAMNGKTCAVGEARWDLGENREFYPHGTKVGNLGIAFLLAIGKREWKKARKLRNEIREEMGA